MNPTETPPRIRMGLDFFPVQHEGKRMIAIRDPLSITEETILVLPHVFLLLSLMDGRTSLREIGDAFRNQFGTGIEEEQISDLVSDLDERGFMDTPAFLEKLKIVEDSFLSQPVRPPALAGRAYPSNRHEVVSFLDNHFEGLKGDVPRDGREGDMAGLVAPHIDLNRGGHLFAMAYDGLRRTQAPDSAIIFGTVHFGEGGPYILTKKDFETPLGIAKVDNELCEAIEASCGTSIRDGELIHRSEHSVEFQVLLLQYVFGSDAMPKIVPVLCSSLTERLAPGASPYSLPAVEGFISAARKAVTDCKGSVLVVAGADMCHVGSKFGTSENLSPDYLKRVRQEDEEALARAADLDPEGFYQAVSRIENRNNICSVNSVYTLLKLLEGCRGKCLGYDMAVDEETDSAVGFAALNFWRR